MADYFSIAGKRVLITGGTSGIGLAVARAFVTAGARVVITGRRESGADIAAGIGAAYVAMDVGDSVSITHGTKTAADQLGGGIDVAVLNAGITLDSGFTASQDMEAVRRTFEVNTLGVAQGLRDVIPFMQRGGSIIVTSSPASTELMPGAGAYAASKAAVNALVRTAALELGPEGIRVNAVMPGVIRTEMSIDPDDPEGELEMLATLTATGVVRDAAEMAPIFHFLASDGSAPCTGALLECEDGVCAGFSALLWDKAFGAA